MPVVVAVVVELAAFYLALGFVLPFAWLFGVTSVVLLVRRLPGRERRRAVAVAGSVLLYGLATWGLRNAMAGETYETKRMTWEERGTDNGYGEPEIELTFVDAPAHSHGVYSADLARYLRATGTDTVDVTFRITSYMGCRLGTTPWLIAGIGRWRSRSGYARFRGSGGEPPPSPWEPDPFWCR